MVILDNIFHPATEKSCSPTVIFKDFSYIEYIFFHPFYIPGRTLGNGNINRHSSFLLRFGCLVGKTDIQNIISI